MDMLAKAAPCRVQKDVLHQTMNQKVSRKQRPVWDDPTRGMFIALLRQSTRCLPSRNFPVECTIDGLRTIDIAVFRVVAEIMKKKDGFDDFTEHMALEKWAWLCSMYAKAKAVNKIGNPIVWRYSNSMDFMGDDACTTQPFVDLLTTETFVHLCHVFEANDNDKDVIAAFNLISENYTRRKSRRSLDSVVSAIKHEMEPPIKVQIVEAPFSISDAPNTRMTTRAQARSAPHGHAVVKMEIKEEADVHDEKFERMDKEEEEREIDFTGSSNNGTGAQIGPLWTKEMIDQLVEEVKKRQNYWDTAHVDYRSNTKRKDAQAAVAHAINITHGSALTDKDIQVKWNKMRGAFHKMIEYYKNTLDAPTGHFYEQMSFLLVNNRNGSGDLSTPSPASNSSEEERNTVTPTVTVTEGPSQPLNLHQLLNGITGETTTKQTLKHMLDAGLMPQIVVSAAVGAAGGSNGVGASTSNGPIGLAATSVPTGVPNSTATSNGVRNPQNAQRETRRMDSEVALLTRAQSDSWGVFGRLIEISGREMNRVSPALAIRMQRALHEVLYEYRLEGAQAGLQL